MPPEAVVSLLSRRYPSLAVGAIEFLGEGDFYRAYAADGAWVVRIARHAEAADALRREACLLPRIAPRLPLRVPRPVFAFGGDGADPAFAVHPMLPGPVLTCERYLAVPEPVRERCARQVGRFLAAMHRTDHAPAHACGVPTAGYRSRYAALLERARSGLLAQLPRPERTYVERTLEEYVGCDAAAAFQPALLHGDLSPDHVLYDEAAGEIGGIIDFGDMTIGDPAWDLVYVYEDYGLDFLARLLPAYATGEPDAVLRRMQRFLELDAIDGAVRCREDGDESELAGAIAYLGRLRARAHAPPWRTLL